jgi:IS30 family transposase
MHLRSDSAAGVRFLAGMRERRGLTPSARAAGVGKATGYRWLREAFLALREDGCSVEHAQAELGYYSALVLEWDRQRLTAPGGRRHHLAIDQSAEDAFWRSFLGGDTLESAQHAAGISRATSYRWWQQRFVQLREQGQSARAAAHRLRVPPAQVRAWEATRHRVAERARRERTAADRRAVRQSSRHAELLMRARAPRSDVEARDTRYWQLMRSGMTNTAACKILGVSRRTGVLIRAIPSANRGPGSPGPLIRAVSVAA